MKFSTNNLNKTTCKKGVVLPQDIWLYGGHYIIEKVDDKQAYMLYETNKQAFNKAKKDFGYFGVENFENMKYKEIIELEEFVNYLFCSNDVAFIKQYARYLIKEQSAKFDCYKKNFDSKLTLREIENKFKNLPYIKPYYETAKNFILNNYVKFEIFPKGRNNERY